MQFGSAVRVDSVGLRPGEEVSYMAAFVVDEAGGDISGYSPKGFDFFETDYFEDGPFDLIVSLSPEAHHTALGLVPRACGGRRVLADLRPLPGGRLARTGAYGVPDGAGRACPAHRRAVSAPIDGIGSRAYKAPRLSRVWADVQEKEWQRKNYWNSPEP